ncbi:MAG: hypothetical protein SPL13_04685 [Clostridia bacterium]|nr:hypothetical protein [Clostridia bacterium]
MDLENLINAFIPYGLPSLIVGVAVGIVFAIADKILAKNGKTVSAYLPLAVSFVLCVLYSVIISPENVVLEQSTSAGLLSGSLSTAVFAFIKNLKSNKADFTPIKSLLSCYMDDKKASELNKKISELIKNKDENLPDSILNMLKKENLNEIAAKDVAEKICGETVKTPPQVGDGQDKDKR